MFKAKTVKLYFLCIKNRHVIFAPLIFFLKGMITRYTFFLLMFFSIDFGLKAQEDTIAVMHNTIVDTLLNEQTNKNLQRNRIRQKMIGYGSIAAYGAMLYTLNKAWYAGYPRSSFHFYNDNGEWNQIDKVGHSWSAYQLTRASHAAWQWAGASDKKALLYSGLSGPAFLTVIEILDGFSDKWGFSWGDMGANVFGSGMFLGQQALWNEQRISFKFSFHRKNYKDALLETRANDLFGKNWNERMLKDYNAQTYWLSANIKSFLPESRLPAWLNIAAGYGADNMYGGYRNEWTAKDGNSYNRNDLKRTRQFYIAPDVDLTRIKTKSKFLKTSFFLLNCIKFPAPALMVDTKGKVKAHWMYF